MSLHEPEVSYIHTYCPDCDNTFLLREVSYPSGREHEALGCPTCKKVLDVQVETETTYLLGQAKGDVGEEIFNVVKEREKGPRMS